MGSRQQSRLIALLDDFDRTIELMDTAADSEGKADEQFAKYADTMEYKLNQLGTEWEKFKTHIIEEDLFKNSIDSLTEFVEKLNELDLKNPFDIAKVGASITAIITGITKVIALVKTTFSTTSTSMLAIKKELPSLLGKVAENKVLNKKNQLELKLEPVLDQKVLDSQLNGLQQKLKSLQANKNYTIPLAVDLSKMDQAIAQSGGQSYNQFINSLRKSGDFSTEEIKAFKQQVKELAKELENTEGRTYSIHQAFQVLRNETVSNYLTAEQMKQILEQLDPDINLTEKEIQELTQKINQNQAAMARNEAESKKYEQELENIGAAAQRSSAKVQKFAAGGVTILSNVLSSALMYIPMVASGMMSIGDAAKMAAPQIAIMVASQELMNYTSALSTVIKTNEKIATEGLTLANIKLAAAEAAAAAPIFPYIAALALLVGAIAGVITISKKWADAHDKVKIAAKELKEEEEKLKEVQEARTKTKATKNETRTELENTKKIKDQWIELSQIKNKTTEQQEEEKNLIEKIREQFPEIITYYDSINNKLDLSIEKWEKIIEKQKEAAEKSAKNDYIVASVEANQTYNKTAADIEKRKATDPLVNVNTENYLMDFDFVNKARQTAQRTLGKGLSYDQYKRALINLGFTEEFLDLFTKMENYNLETLDGIKNFIYGPQLTSSDLNKYLKLYRDRLTEISDNNKQYELAMKDAQELLKTTAENNLKTYLENTTGDSTLGIITAKTIQKSNKEIDYSEYYKDYVYGGKTSKVKYSDLTNNGLNLLESFGITTEEQFKQINEEILRSYIEAAITVDQNQDLINSANEAIGTSSYKYLSQILDGSIDYTQQQLNQKIAAYSRSGSILDQAIADALGDIRQSNFIDINKELREIYGKPFGTDQSASSLQSFYLASRNFIDKYSKENVNALNFLNDTNSYFDKNNFSLDTRTAIISKDLWESYSPLDVDAFKDKLQNALIDVFDGSTDKASKAVEKVFKNAKDNGIISDDLTPDIISSYVEKATKIQEAFQEAGKDLELFNAQGLKTVELSATQLDNYEKLRETLLEIGVAEAKDLLTKNESGKWILDIEKANEIMNKYGADSVAMLKIRKRDIDNQIDSLIKEGDIENEKLISLQAQSDELEKQIPLLESATDKANEMANAFDYAEKRLSEMSNLSSAVSSALSKFQKNKFLGQSEIASLQSGFSYFGIDANQFINKSLGLTNPETLYKTAIRELQKSIRSGVFGDDKDKINQAKGTIAELYSAWMDYLQDVEDEQEKIKDKEEDIEEAKKKVLEQEEKVREKEEQNEKDRKKALEDIKKAEEDLVKAKEDYVDQLEVIEEKQKAINDEIDKYNELLYGTKNRKGKLDAFYNYEEAISSLSNELSRTTELLGKSEDIDSSVEALQRYTKATNNLIATEKAKQIQIQAGLSNYANMIENGYASYTNKETGQQIGINFGQYAKKDQATGKYILNQRLLNQASFNDEYKNLIEENIETYNKYVDEYEKINDEILKSEKELQDKRKAALKAYSEIEQNVADALKEQYQKEVDELKNKYDSMKAADDDYLSALEDAINKQRELREREDKYEELAEQEKRLSLLQRDTSGTRQIDANKLKKDVEKTRKQLLDDAVNDVVDGLKKLAQENEETRQVELQLRDAIIENTAHWNGEAQAIVPTINTADDYANYMASLNPNYSSMTLSQQQVLIDEYKQQFADALEYQAWNLLDTTAASGDAIVDTINVSTDQILAITTEKTTSFSEEVIRSYNEITEKVGEDLEKQEESIQNARDALQDAVDKLDELSKKIDEAAQKIVDLNEEEVKANEKRIKELEEEKQKVIEYQEDVIEKAKEIAKAQAEAIGANLSGLSDVINVQPSENNTSLPSSNNESIYTKSNATHNYHSSMEGKTLDEAIDLYNQYRMAYNAKKDIGGNTTEITDAMYNVVEVIEDILGLSGNHSLKDINAFLEGKTDKKLAYKKGGLVNFTGPAWVDGTRAAPEAFLSAEDTKAIGAAAQILSDLQLIKDYSSLGQQINNTVGDTSIEINLNIDKLSSEIDVENMIQRVKNEIVEVANPIGINTILKQN